MQPAVQTNTVQEGMLDILQQVLQEVPVRAAGLLWEQGRVPLLQQLEDQGGRPQMPLNCSAHR